MIDIKDTDYKSITEDYISYADTESGRVYKAIKDGTILPKGHGRLGDLDAVYAELKKYLPAVYDDSSLDLYEEGIYAAMVKVREAETILEADKEQKE